MHRIVPCLPVLFSVFSPLYVTCQESVDVSSSSTSHHLAMDLDGMDLLSMPRPESDQGPIVLARHRALSMR